MKQILRSRKAEHFVYAVLTLYSIVYLVRKIVRYNGSWTDDSGSTISKIFQVILGILYFNFLLVFCHHLNQVSKHLKLFFLNLGDRSYPFATIRVVLLLFLLLGLNYSFQVIMIFFIPEPVKEFNIS